MLVCFRKCCSLWVVPSCIMPIASRSTVPSAPATPRSQRSWLKVKPCTHWLASSYEPPHTPDSYMVVYCFLASVAADRWGTSVAQEACCFIYIPCCTEGELQLVSAQWGMNLSRQRVWSHSWEVFEITVEFCSYYYSRYLDRHFNGHLFMVFHLKMQVLLVVSLPTVQNE